MRSVSLAFMSRFGYPVSLNRITSVSTLVIMHTCSVVIPVYNSEGSLRPLIERLAAVLPAISSACEVILVNDASRDASWDVICQLKAEYEWVGGINLMRNYGQHNALLCGIRAARYELVITMDDDLQHPPEELHRMIARLDEPRRSPSWPCRARWGSIPPVM